MRKVIGSSPISSTKKKKSTQEGGLFVFGMVLEIGLEPIAEQQSGGLLLSPVQTLVTTFVFANGKNATESYIVHQRKVRSIEWAFFFMSSGRPLAVGQVIDLSPISSTKKSPPDWVVIFYVMHFVFCGGRTSTGRIHRRRLQLRPRRPKAKADPFLLLPHRWLGRRLALSFLFRVLCSYSVV